MNQLKKGIWGEKMKNQGRNLTVFFLFEALEEDGEVGAAAALISLEGEVDAEEWRFNCSPAPPLLVPPEIQFSWDLFACAENPRNNESKLANQETQEITPL